LVADALEADWNARLRDLVEAQREYEQQRQADLSLPKISSELILLVFSEMVGNSIPSSN
jgi:hypothetical protein